MRLDYKVETRLSPQCLNNFMKKHRAERIWRSKLTARCMEDNRCVKIMGEQDEQLRSPTTPARVAVSLKWRVVMAIQCAALRRCYGCCDPPLSHYKTWSEYHECAAVRTKGHTAMAVGDFLCISKSMERVGRKGAIVTGEMDVSQVMWRCRELGL